MNDPIQRFRDIAHDCDFASIRLTREESDVLRVRQDVLEPVRHESDAGAMITVVSGDGMGYAATPDTSERGLRDAFERALRLARASRGKSVVDWRRVNMPRPAGTYQSPLTRDPVDVPLTEKIDLLRAESARCKASDQVVDWEVSLWTTHAQQRYATLDSGEVEQTFRYIVPNVRVTAHRNGVTQTRTFGGNYNGFCRQGGLEVLERCGFIGAGASVADEALQLVGAANCPTGAMDVLLAPDQMMLQIHESIGHPLELDRILGDERNFAGTSFVTLDMFGSYQYGSPLLNVTYDPERPEQFASYAYDDEGSRAERTFVIENGILKRPLGGAISQARAGIDGVANSRACSWNRAPIDRMANLNVEPGHARLDQLIAAIDDGVLMKTNASWSIDDSRNKFQFGCEWGQRIRHGKLGEIVRNPNYRGVSATFWRSLKAVGDASTLEVLGSPYCGKGEPSQVIRVGHAAPACVFGNVQVFGGAA